MRFKSLLLLKVFIVAVLGAPSLAERASIFSDVTIYAPPSNYNTPRVLYARTVLLDNGYLLATWENYRPEPPAVYSHGPSQRLGPPLLTISL